MNRNAAKLQKNYNRGTKILAFKIIWLNSKLGQNKKVKSAFKLILFIYLFILQGKNQNAKTTYDGLTFQFCQYFTTIIHLSLTMPY
jgi:hypothetical protein